MKSLTLVSSVPITEPVVRNRLVPFFMQFNQQGFSINFVCPASQGNAELLPSYVKLSEVALDYTKPQSFIKRAIREMRDVSQLLAVAKNNKADYYLLTMPSMFIAFLAPWKLRKQKVFLDIRDLTWEYLSNKSFTQRLAKKIFAAWFKSSLNFFKGICVTNTTEMNYVLPLWKGQLKPELVTNGISQAQYKKLQGLKPAAQKNIVYIGNVGLAQNLETFVQAAKLLPEINFQIVGSGIDLERVQQIAQQEQVENVEFVGRVSWDEVRNYYDEAHILYAQLTPDYAGAMPSKLYEYLATGKYVVYGGQGQATEILANFEHNQVVLPNDVEALAGTFNQVLKDKASTLINEANQVQIKDKYIREKAAERFILLF